MSAAQSGRAAFVQWARRSLVRLPDAAQITDAATLARFGQIVGDADIVALSEGAHAAAEPLEFRNQVFRYLVESKGFTAIAIESGLVEGRVVHEYVRGKGGDLLGTLAQGIGWTFDRLPQNRELVRWLEEYNADPRRSRKINFYGFDVPGSPGNGDVKRGPGTPLIEALRFLDRVDPEAATHFHSRIDRLVPHLRLDCTRRGEGTRYTRLEQVQRDTLTAAIADLVTLVERCEAIYTRATSDEEYAWGYRSAIGARQIDAWLRHVPPCWEPPGESIGYSAEEQRLFAAALDFRDRAQFDNLRWIIDRERGGKLLIFASRFHLSAAPFKTAFSTQQTAGTYLRRFLGERLRTIGNLVGGGVSGEGNIARAAPETIDGVAGEMGVPRYLLDLRTAPTVVGHWLAEERPLGAGQEGCRLPIGRAFDALLYLERLTLA
jgi:erythromycin esterase